MLLALLLPLLASAQNYFVTDPSNPDTYGGDGTFGGSLQPIATVQVTALGAWDVNLDGFANAPQVGLWNTNGTLLASVTLQPGTASALTGAFRYENLSTPLTLQAGTTYYLGGYFNTSQDYAAVNGTFSYNTIYFNVVDFNNRLPFSFGLPTADIAAAPAPGNISSVNLIFTPVPEPGALSLLAVAGVALLGIRRWRR